MSANGLEVFDKTIQTTHVWLNEITEVIGPDRELAWKVLYTVLHKLRDRLTLGVAAHLGAQLPLLIRGAYYDQFQPAKQPSSCRDLDEFVAEVQEWLADVRPVNGRDAVDAVFATLSRHVPEGQLAIVRNALPASIRDRWIGLENQMTPPLARTQADQPAAAGRGH